MGVLNKLFSGGASKLVESVGGVLDNVITTKDEKLEAKRKLKELILSHEAEMERNITGDQAAQLNLFHSDLIRASKGKERLVSRNF